MPRLPGLAGGRPGRRPWAQDQLAPEQAWKTGRGDGVVVAVVDSGVDASLPELAGRVSAGVNVVSGLDDGNRDCLGSGTAMAALIAGRNPQRALGIAPNATILPIRIATNQPSVPVADQVTAIDVAVSAGARIIALGSYVDITASSVLAAVANAGRHDVVVVVAGPVSGEGALPPSCCGSARSVATANSPGPTRRTVSM